MLPAFFLTVITIIASLSVLGNLALVIVIYFIGVAYHRLDTRTARQLRGRLADQRNTERLAEKYKAERIASHTELLTTLLTVSERLHDASHSIDVRARTALVLNYVKAELKSVIRTNEGVLPANHLDQVLKAHGDRFGIKSYLKGPAAPTTVTNPLERTDQHI